MRKLDRPMLHLLPWVYNLSRRLRKTHLSELHSTQSSSRCRATCYVLAAVTSCTTVLRYLTLFRGVRISCLFAAPLDLNPPRVLYLPTIRLA